MQNPSQNLILLILFMSTSLFREAISRKFGPVNFQESALVGINDFAKVCADTKLHDLRMRRILEDQQNQEVKEENVDQKQDVNAQQKRKGSKWEERRVETQDEPNAEWKVDLKEKSKDKQPYHSTESKSEEKVELRKQEENKIEDVTRQEQPKIEDKEKVEKKDQQRSQHNEESNNSNSRNDWEAEKMQEAKVVEKTDEPRMEKDLVGKIKIKENKEVVSKAEKKAENLSQPNVEEKKQELQTSQRPEEKKEEPQSLQKPKEKKEESQAWQQPEGKEKQELQAWQKPEEKKEALQALPKPKEKKEEQQSWQKREEKKEEKTKENEKVKQPVKSTETKSEEKQANVKREEDKKRVGPKEELKVDEQKSGEKKDQQRPQYNESRDAKSHEAQVAGKTLEVKVDDKQGQSGTEKSKLQQLTTTEEAQKAESKSEENLEQWSQSPVEEKKEVSRPDKKWDQPGVEEKAEVKVEEKKDEQGIELNSDVKKEERKREDQPAKEEKSKTEDNKEELQKEQNRAYPKADEKNEDAEAHEFSDGEGIQDAMLGGDVVDPDEESPDFLGELTNLPSSLHETGLSVVNHIRALDKYTSKSKDYLNYANQQIQESFLPLIGRDYATIVAYLVSYGALLLPLFLVGFFFDRIRAIFSLQKVLLFVNIYLASYFGALLLATFVLGSEPMEFLRKFSPSSYIFLQLFQAFGYLVYFLLQTFDLITTCSAGRIAAKSSALTQWIVASAVGLHYYVTVFHRAMAKLQPHTSWKIHGLYSLGFAVLCLFARIERVKKQYVQLGDKTTDKKN